MNSAFDGNVGGFLSFKAFRSTFFKQLYLDPSITCSSSVIWQSISFPSSAGVDDPARPKAQYEIGELRERHAGKLLRHENCFSGSLAFETDPFQHDQCLQRPLCFVIWCPARLPGREPARLS